MQTSDILIIQPDTREKLNALKIFLTTFNLNFVIEKPYNEEFVNKIQKSRKEFIEGKFITVDKENLRTFLGV